MPCYVYDSYIMLTLLAGLPLLLLPFNLVQLLSRLYEMLGYKRVKFLLCSNRMLTP